MGEISPLEWSVEAAANTMVRGQAQTSGGSRKPKGDIFELEGERVRRYLWVCGVLENVSKILDVGCGYGYGADYLARELDCSVLGIDTDFEAIQYARRTYCRRNLSFQLMDATRISLQPESFDAVVSFEVIEHLADPIGYLEGIRTVLKPKGLFILSTPNKRYTALHYKQGRPTNPYHVEEYYPNEARGLLTQFFAVDGIYREFSLRDMVAARLYRRINESKALRPVIGAIPTSAKNMLTGLRKAPILCLFTGSTKGRWKNYRIDKVVMIQEMDERFPVQIYSCRKK